mgnify:CR=1 FL=1
MKKMNTLNTLEEKINKILAKNFTQKMPTQTFYIPNERQLIFTYKSGMAEIVIKLNKQENKEEEKIHQLTLYNRMSGKHSPMILTEHHKFDDKEKKNKILNKLVLMKTRVYFAHIFK